MEETKDEPADAKSEQSSEENFTWEEWTVIDDGENSKNQKTSQSLRADEAASSDTSFSDIEDTSDAEEARECIDVIAQRDVEESPDKTGEGERCNDESDGVSVITESEADEPVHEVNEGALVVYRNDSGSVARSLKDTEIDNLRMMKTLQVFLVVCCLLGMGILCIAINNGVPRNSNGNDLPGNSRCNSLFEPIEETTDGSRIAREVESVKRKSIFAEDKLRNHTLNEAKQMPDVQDHPRAIDPSIIDPDNAVFERLQIFLRTMCTLMEDTATTVRSPGCETSLPELIDLRRLLKSVVRELDTSERSTHEIFLRNLDLQIESASDELVADFARALNKLASKNQRRVDKIGVKLAKRLCVLRNTLPSDSGLRETLERSNTFLAKCGRAETKKFDRRRKKDTSGSTEQPKSKKRGSREKESDGHGFAGKSRGYPSKRQNETRTIDKSTGSGDNPWDTRECNSKGLPDVPTLLPPPTSSCGLKRRSSLTAKDRGGIEEARMTEDNSGKHRSKGDRGGSKVIKTQSLKDFDKRNYRKQRTSASNVEDHTMERTTENNNEKAAPRSVLSGPRSIDADKKNKKVYPSGPARTRENKHFEKEYREFILLDRREEKGTLRKNGHWQFDRSQIRDKLRKDKSRSNWYTDRVGNWQFVRSQIRDKSRGDESRSNWYFDRAGNRKSSRNDL